MKNLKRMLSLALAGAMLGGMMVMGAGAIDFPDSDEIDHTEAVDIMGSLNIINGYDDGSFHPDAYVTRGQMAKMIAVAMNGGKEPNSGVKTTATFSDIKGKWAESYIEWCYDLKIINGRGDGTFDPEGNVTAVEAAKMILTALNYDATSFQLVGREWDVHTNYEATQTCKPSLYDGLDGIVLTEPLTRDNAAQLIWNGLQNETLRKTPTTVVSTGEVEYMYTPSGESMLEGRYDAHIGYGLFTDNANTSTGMMDGYVKLTSARMENSAGASYGRNGMGPSGYSNNCTFPYDVDMDLFGEEVKVIWKDGSMGTKLQPDKGDTIYGVFRSGATSVVTATRNDIGEVKSATKRVLKIDGVEYDLNEPADGGVQVVYNYRTGGDEAATGAANITYTFTSDSDLIGTSGRTSYMSGYLKAPNGDTIKAILNDDGQIETVYVTASKIGVVTGVSSDKITVNNGVGTIKIADNDVYEGIAKDDVVVTTTLYNTDASDDQAFTIVEKAEVVTGDIDKIKNNNDKDAPYTTRMESVTVAGTTYKVYSDVKDQSTTLYTNGLSSSKRIGLLDKSDLNDEVNAYLVNGYVAAMVKTEADAKNYCAVIDVSSTPTSTYFDNVQIRVLEADGTKTVLTLDKDDSVKIDGTTKIATSSDIARGDLVTYTINSDGKAVVKIKATNATGSYSYDKDKKELTAPGATYVVSNDCVLYVKTGTDTYKAYTARNVATFGSGTSGAVVASGNKAEAVYVELPYQPGGAGDKKVFGMVTGGGQQVKIDGTEYIEWTISVNGEDYDVLQTMTAWTAAKDTAVFGVTGMQLAKGMVVGFEPTADGIYNDASDFEPVAKRGNFTYSFTDGSKAGVAWVDEYDVDGGIITTFVQIEGVKNDGNVKTTYTWDGTNPAADSDIVLYQGVDTAAGTKTYAVDSDVRLWFVDCDNDKAPAGGSVDTFNSMSGKLNAVLVFDSTMSKVTNIIVETSGVKGVNE